MRTRFLSTLVVLVGLSGNVHAQSADVPLARLLPDLVLRSAELALDTAVGGVDHTAHFTPLNDLFIGNNPGHDARPRVEAAQVVLNFNKLMAAQFATFPLGSSSGGFTFRIDETTGLPARASRSFGPAFAERSLSVGKRQLSLGFNYQHTSWDTYEGKNLEDGSVVFYLRHNDCCPGQAANPNPLQARGDGSLTNPGFEGDLVRMAVSIRASSDTATLFATYGVTDRWDVGVALPLVSVDLALSADAEILRLATAPAPTVHTFAAGQDLPRRTFPERRGSATGLGDIVLRSKYNFLQQEATGLAAAIDVRLPTGREEDLIGTGATQTKLYLVASTGTDRLAEHFNIGYTISGESDLARITTNDPTLLQALLPASTPSNEFNYTAGFELVASDRVTILGDVMGRSLIDAGRLDFVAREFTYRAQTAAGQPAAPDTTVRFQEFAAREGSLHTLLGTVGVKINPGGRLLLAGHVVFPLSDAGLRSRFAAIVGLDYAF